MKLLLKKPDEDEAIRHLMERMKLLLKNVQKPWQDSEVDHHVDRRVPLTAQDLSRGLGCLRKDLQLSSWKRENKEDKEAHKKVRDSSKLPGAACGHLDSGYHSVSPRWKAGETACSLAGG